MQHSVKDIGKRYQELSESRKENPILNRINSLNSQNKIQTNIQS
jgi:hypothetical protein